MRTQIDDDYVPALKYLAKLTKRSVDSIVAEALDEWLRQNYCELVEPIEQGSWLHPTVLHTKKGNFRYAKSRENLLDNLYGMGVRLPRRLTA